MRRLVSGAKCGAFPPACAFRCRQSISCENRFLSSETPSNIACEDEGMGKRKADEEDLGEADGKDKVDLYQVLGVNQSATEQQIRKAYHKLALQLHPDKNPDDQDAKEKFQSLQSVIAILGDPQKREVYDRTGSIEDVEFSDETVQDWYKYFRNIYEQITEDKIEKFVASYQGSPAEVVDLKNLYVKHKGNMQRVFLHLICSDPSQDSHRFKEIIEEAIVADELKEYKAYRKWAKDVSKLPSPRTTARKKNTVTAPSSDLVALIQGRKQQMDTLTASLEAKYGGARKSKYEEPSEEEFQEARKSLTQRSTTPSKKKDSSKMKSRK